MAITFPSVFQSAIATNPADTAAGYLTPTRHNQGAAPAGLTATRVPYALSATEFTDSANLTYTETSGPRLQVGSGSGTSTGWILGYLGASGYGGMWLTSQTPNTANMMYGGNLTNTFVQGGTSVQIRPLSGSGAVLAEWFCSVAGKGLYLSPGTATTDVQALSATQTWNASGVAFTGLKYTITDTASAAGSLAMQILGGAAGTTNLFSVGKTGIVTVGDILVLKGYAVASLPTGIDGAIAMVTDQLTTVAAKGVAPTGGGSVHCAVIYNGAAWVGI